MKETAAEMNWNVAGGKKSQHGDESALKWRVYYVFISVRYQFPNHNLQALYLLLMTKQLTSRFLVEIWEKK